MVRGASSVLLCLLAFVFAPVKECCNIFEHHKCELPSAGMGPSARVFPSSRMVLTKIASLMPFSYKQLTAKQQIATQAIRATSAGSSPIGIWRDQVINPNNDPGRNFDLVVCLSELAHVVFMRVAGRLKCPVDESARGHESERYYWQWELYQRAMKDEEEVMGKPFWPIMAVQAGSVWPCAIGLYSEPEDNEENTFFLSKLIRNRGKECDGAGAAILCFLIKHSRNTQDEFSPLQLAAPQGAARLSQYYAEFGCEGKFILSCRDPDPPKCRKFPYNGVWTGDDYFNLAEAPEYYDRYLNPYKLLNKKKNAGMSVSDREGERGGARKVQPFTRLPRNPYLSNNGEATEISEFPSPHADIVHSHVLILSGLSCGLMFVLLHVSRRVTPGAHEHALFVS